MNRAIVTYAAGAHEELLDVGLPTYREFAAKHHYDLCVTRGVPKDTKCIDPSLPAPWNKVRLLMEAIQRYDEVVWFDCDLVVVNPHEDFPPIDDGKMFAMVRHFEDNSEVPNSGVWRLRKSAGVMDLLQDMMRLEVFRNHGWWEQAALLTLMGYCVPPEGSHFPDTKCRCVYKTKWYEACQFMRLRYNSHPNYRAEKPVVVHCSYPDMPRRLEVMRALVRDPNYDYPKYENKRFDIAKEEDDELPG